MAFGVHHGWDYETPEAKARWFQSLPLQERMDVFCELTELILSVNPRLMELKNAQPLPKGVRLLRLP